MGAMVRGGPSARAGEDPQAQKSLEGWGAASTGRWDCRPHPGAGLCGIWVCEAVLGCERAVRVETSCPSLHASLHGLPQPCGPHLGEEPCGKLSASSGAGTHPGPSAGGAQSGCACCSRGTLGPARAHTPVAATCQAQVQPEEKGRQCHAEVLQVPGSRHLRWAGRDWAFRAPGVGKARPGSFSQCL